MSKPEHSTRSTASSQPLPTRPKIDSRAFFGASNEIVIEHMGEEYRMRITSNGKLILTNLTLEAVSKNVTQAV